VPRTTTLDKFKRVAIGGNRKEVREQSSEDVVLEFYEQVETEPGVLPRYHEGLKGEPR
jgi:hypothetical protein